MNCIRLETVLDAGMSVLHEAAPGQALSFLRQHRIGYGNNTFTNVHGNLSNNIKTVSNKLPAQWVDASNDFSALYVNANDYATNGTYNYVSKSIVIPPYGYRQVEKSMAVPQLLCHEFGHRMQHVLPELLELEHQFFEKYGHNKDAFISEYSQTRYKKMIKGTLQPSELFTVGFEMCVGPLSKKQWTQKLQDNPHGWFTLGCLLLL